MPNHETPRPRTLDERLDGLTQSLEIVAAMQRETGKRFQENETRYAAIASNIGDRVTVAQFHERCLARLEGQQP